MKKLSERELIDIIEGIIRDNIANGGKRAAAVAIVRSSVVVGALSLGLIVE